MPDNVTYRIGYIRYIESKTTPLFSESDVQAFLKIINGNRLKANLKTHRDHVAHVKSIHAWKIERQYQYQDVPAKECDNNFGVDKVSPADNRSDLTQILMSDSSRGSKSKNNSIGGIRTQGEKAMSEEEKKPAFFKFKTALVFCIGICVVVLAILYVRPIVVGFMHKDDVIQRTSEIQTNSLESPAPSSEDRKPKEYRFTDDQINKAMRQVGKSRTIDLSSPHSTDENRSLYEIEFVSGGRVYSENVAATKNTIIFENEKGLVVSVNRSEVTNLKRLVAKGANQSANYTCQGKTHCSQMSSCEEAKFYLRNCPSVKIDGDGNGVPCEKQWCGK